ncbi:hypothetical protein MKK70_23200 [Methylobacterium sp. E-041]|uniref:hypothetical protein n=1 Tax=unclassified Methylobacterium TaxID=2615210 RepID=UPI001FBC116E|nr:hypothetical protein [Methylobacterium sp. E-041]MCJ2108220.1 hypothetical protein [Methylobacterium sp. E-041]
MARTPPNGRSPSISMSDFNARVKRVLEGNEEVTRGAPRATPGWSRRRTRPSPGAEAQPEPEAAEAETVDAETDGDEAETEKPAAEEV